MDLIILFIFLKNLRKDFATIRFKSFVTLAIFLLFSISIISYFYPLPGGTEDAILFRTKSSLDFTFDIGTSFFLFVSGVLKKLSFSGEFSLYLIPTILSSIVLIDIYKNLLFHKRYQLIYILYLFSPALYINCTIPLREAYQLFFLYFSIKLILSNNKVSSLYALLLSSLHKGLLVFIPFLLVKNINKLILILLIFVFFSTGVLFYLPESRGFEILKMILNGNIFDFTLNYRDSLESLGSNTTYLITNESTIMYFVNIFLAYFFGPLFFFSAVNPIFYFDALWRTTVLCILITNYNKLNKKLIFLYFIISMIWAAGTVNFGQLIRHHVMHDFILILILNDITRFNRNRFSKDLFK